MRFGVFELEWPSRLQAPLDRFVLIEDSRQQHRVVYPLSEMMLRAVCGTVVDCDDDAANPVLLDRLAVDDGLKTDAIACDATVARAVEDAGADCLLAGKAERPTPRKGHGALDTAVVRHVSIDLVRHTEIMPSERSGRRRPRKNPALPEPVSIKLRRTTAGWDTEILDRTLKSTTR